MDRCGLSIRPETIKDIEIISHLTTAAFLNKSYSDGTEALVVERLRSANALTLSLVGEIEGRVVCV